VTDFFHAVTFYEHIAQCLEQPDFIKNTQQELEQFEINIIKGNDVV